MSSPNKRLLIGIGIGIITITATISLISYLFPPKTEEKGKKKDFDNLQILKECDLPISTLLDMTSEEKQRIFYALLMRGEMLLGQISRDSSSPSSSSSLASSNTSLSNLNKAIEYFSKAISIVPNPAEVIQALQQSIPPAVFSLLIERVQKDLKSKVDLYFKTLDNEMLTFIHEDGSSPNAFYPHTTHDLKKDAIIWKEVADISQSANDGYCDCCLVEVVESKHKCPLCETEEFVWCSEECRIKSSPMFHDYFCGEENATALECLYYIKEYSGFPNDCRLIPLLITRYVAMLLAEEMAGNSVSRVGGPFNHYDHLVAVMKSPSSEDIIEARMIRELFSNSVLARKTNVSGGDASGVLEFLTDQVYSIMKGTLQQNVIRLSSKTFECRTVSDENGCPSMHLFHCAAHLSHSCDPNCYVVIEGNHLILKSKRNIPSGTPLTVSFLPFSTGTSSIDRKIKLESTLGIKCKCDLCLAEMTIC